MKQNFTTFLILITLTALLAQPSTGTQAGQISMELNGDAFLTTEPSWETVNGIKGSEYGRAVAMINVNGDDFMDAVIGVNKYPVGDGNFVAAYVYLGSAGGLSSVNVAILTPTNSDDDFKLSIASAGDVNNDGNDDLIIGAPGHKEDGINGKPGAAFLYYGTDTGISLFPSWLKVGIGQDVHLGYSVAGAGDVNGDNFDDVLITMTGADNTGDDRDFTATAYLYLGSATGLSQEPDRIYEGVGTHPLSLAGVGDVNSDGYDDYAIGVPYFDTPGYVNNGAVWVYYGNTTEALPISYNWHASGMQSSEYFGNSISGAGKVNEDIYDDLLIGAVGYNDDSRTDVGAGYLYFGSLSGLTHPAAWQVISNQSYSGFGTSVTGLGDINGDSLGDVAIGAPQFAVYSEDDQGAVNVYCSTGENLSQIPNWIGYGGKANTEFGFSISGGGDLSKDGFNDLVVGAPSYMQDDKTKMGWAGAFHGVYGVVSIFDNSIYLPFILSNP